MTVGSSLLIAPSLRFVEAEPFDDGRRTKIKNDFCLFLYQCIIEAVFCSIMRIDIDRDRTCNTDGIRDLNGAFVGQPSSNNVFGNVACCISGTAVNL